MNILAKEDFRLDACKGCERPCQYSILHCTSLWEDRFSPTAKIPYACNRGFVFRKAVKRVIAAKKPYSPVNFQCHCDKYVLPSLGITKCPGCGSVYQADIDDKGIFHGILWDNGMGWAMFISNRGHRS